MSLVNDMLNDLEKRRHQQPAQQEDLSWLVSSESRPRHRRWFFYGLLALIVTACIYWINNQYLAHSALPVAQQALIDAQSTPSPVQDHAVDEPEALSAAVELKVPTAQQPLNASVPSKPVLPVPTKTAELPQKPKPANHNSDQAVSIVDSVSEPYQAKKLVVSQTVKTVTPPTVEQLDARKALQVAQLLRSGDTMIAEQQLRDFLAQAPLAAKSSGLLVELLLNQKRIDDAQLVLNGLQSQISEYTELRRLQAYIYVLNGQPEQATKLLLSAKPNVKAETKYYELLASAAQRSGQYVLSTQVYKSLLQGDASVGNWWLGLAISQELSGLKADARANFLQAINTGRLSQNLAEYARRRYNSLAGAVNQLVSETGVTFSETTANE